MNEKTETIGDIPHAQKIMKKITHNSSSISISRLPIKTKDKFIDLADKEFCGDYGFTLKFLMDDLIDSDVRMLMDTISDLTSRVNYLEQNSIIKSEPQKTENTIKMCDGTERTRRGNE